MPTTRKPSAPAIAYLPLEPVASRYTAALCAEHTGWMPSALATQPWRETFYVVPKGDLPVPSDIQVGAVLDAFGRSVYSLRQIEALLELVVTKKLVTGDVVYLQDFWTPGLEALFYTCHLYGVKLRVYAMFHAQSVDPYDFTYPMKHWIRYVEKGYAADMAGLFVASRIHKAQIRQAGFGNVPVHVVGLPFGAKDTWIQYAKKPCEKRNGVVFSSRLDKEKNPDFMLEVAETFLKENPYQTWTVTTSAKKFRSYNNQAIIPRLYALAKRQPRFLLAEGLTKEGYYDVLQRAAVQFNCSHQDYVSWTCLEAALFGCDLAYPCYGSFPEFLPSSCLYDFSLPSARQWSVRQAADMLTEKVACPIQHRNLAAYMDRCRKVIARTMFTNAGCVRDIDVWDGYQGKLGRA